MVSEHWDMSLRVLGTTGEAFIPDFLYQSTTTGSSSRPAPDEREPSTAATAPPTPTSSEAFINAVRDGAPYRTDADDAVATMSLIDDCYRAIGLEPRPSHAYRHRPRR